MDLLNQSIIQFIYALGMLYDIFYSSIHFVVSEQKRIGYHKILHTNLIDHHAVVDIEKSIRRDWPFYKLEKATFISESLMILKIWWECFPDEK